MFALLRNVVLGVVAVLVALLAGGFVGTRMADIAGIPGVTPGAATTTPATHASTTAPDKTASAPKPTQAPATTTPKKPAPLPAPKAPGAVLTPGTPEYQKSLQDAIDALAKLHASAGPATPLNDRVRQALVNINCTAKSVGSYNVTGSGVIIDPKGVILTNSHIAQFYLIRDYPVQGALSCVIRTGSPAYPAYLAELLFVPPSWVQANAQKITETEPVGNGEHDYALLRITGPVNASNAMPAALPYLAPSYAEPATGESVLVAGYAAGFLGGVEVAKNLYASSAYTKIGEIFTYANNTADVFSVGGTIVAQQGSSGGAVANEAGNLVGIVVTSTITADTASRDLKALSLPYIAEDFRKESGFVLQDYLAGNLAQEAATFNAGTAPTLSKRLTDVLAQH